jgi:hypothetical protein
MFVTGMNGKPSFCLKGLVAKGTLPLGMGFGSWEQLILGKQL